MSEKAVVAPDRSGYIKVENGTRQVYWEYFGKREKEVVVLLNGVGMPTKNWHRTLPNVYPEHDLLLYDYLGQGNSSQEDEPYSRKPGFFWSTVRKFLAAKSIDFELANEA